MYTAGTAGAAVLVPGLLTTALTHGNNSVTTQPESQLRCHTAPHPRFLVDCKHCRADGKQLAQQATEGDPQEAAQPRPTRQHPAALIKPNASVLNTRSQVFQELRT